MEVSIGSHIQTLEGGFGVGFRILGFLTILPKKRKRKMKETFNCHLMEGVGGGGVVIACITIIEKNSMSNYLRGGKASG